MRSGKILAAVVVSGLGAILAFAPASAHWVGAAARISANAGGLGSRSATHSGLAGVKGPSALTSCTPFTDSSPDASDASGSVNIDSLDLTSGTISSDGTNLIVVMHVINLGGLGGLPLTPAPYNATQAEWKFGWSNAKGHAQFLEASWVDTQPGSLTSPQTGWSFSSGATNGGATPGDSSGLGPATGVIDVSASTITIKAPLNSFKYGDITASKPDPLAVGELLTNESATTYWLAGAVVAGTGGGLLQTVDADAPTDDNFGGYQVGRNGCTTA